jgi:hypothetical protein
MCFHSSSDFLRDQDKRAFSAAIAKSSLLRRELGWQEDVFATCSCNFLTITCGCTAVRLMKLFSAQIVKHVCNNAVDFTETRTFSRLF